MDDNIHRILVIDLAYIGDLIMATPVISEIKRAVPGARITVLCSPGSSMVLERNPSVDEILPFDMKSAGLKGILSKAGELRDLHFDISFVFHRSFGSALLAFLAGIPVRYGFTTEGRGLLLTHRVKLDRKKHRADNDLALLEKYGFDVNPDAPLVFIPDPGDEGFPREALGQDVLNKGYVVLNPNASWETKMWPVEKFASLVKRLSDSGLTPVGVGARTESGRVDEMLNSLGVNLAGQTDLSKLGVLSRDAACVVTNDSGPMHIAAAVGAKVVALFGPTSPLRCGPRSNDAVVIRRDDLECISCYKKHCPLEFQCMLEISVEQVFNSVMAKIKKENFGHR